MNTIMNGNKHQSLYFTNQFMWLSVLDCKLCSSFVSRKSIAYYETILKTQNEDYLYGFLHLAQVDHIQENSTIILRSLFDYAVFDFISSGQIQGKWYDVSWLDIACHIIKPCFDHTRFIKSTVLMRDIHRCYPESGRFNILTCNEVTTSTQVIKEIDRLSYRGIIETKKTWGSGRVRSRGSNCSYP